MTGRIDIKMSTPSQQRGAHGAFRYFGKLAPDVTGAVLDAASELTEIRQVVDMMCGSGTTLIEASARGWAAIGIDANPVAELFARVKNQPLEGRRYEKFLRKVLEQPVADTREIIELFASTRNSERWFSSEAQSDVTTLRNGISGLPPSPESEALLAALLGRLRRISNASPRTGRIFFDPASAKPAIPEFEAAARHLLDVTPKNAREVTVLHGDARSTPLPDGSCDLAFCHPPYFALYRYSADVLRFEMELGGFDRRSTNGKEVREGWKSGDPGNLDHYVEDMASVFGEAKRIVRARGVLALIVSNSTLGDLQMPVVDRLAGVLTDRGWDIAEHLERTAHFGSAKYHRSARSDKVIHQDHVLLCRPL